VDLPMKPFLLSLPMLAAAAGAAAEGPLRLELNRLEPVQGGCRVYLVGEASQRIEALTLDLVLFDASGVISGRLAVEAGPLRAGRPSVSAFLLDGMECGAVSRILVNDVLACTAASGPLADCLDRIEATSRAAAALVN
jgi:hypothetical protein